MEWRIGLLLGVAVLAGACATSVDDGRVALLARDREFSNAVGDIEKVLSFYTPDASLCLPGMPIATGVENIRSAAVKFGAVPGFSIEWEPTHAGSSASGDVGFVEGTYRMTTDAPDQPPAITGHYVEVWKKTGGEWRVAEHFFHPDPN
jgi:ketosteroid isomerase-like protein